MHFLMVSFKKVQIPAMIQPKGATLTWRKMYSLPIAAEQQRDEGTSKVTNVTKRQFDDLIVYFNEYIMSYLKMDFYK